MVIVTARLDLQPGKTDEFITRTKHIIAASRGEEGNISYELFKSTDKENELIFLEFWKTPEALELHNQTPHFKQFEEIAGEVLASPPDIKSYSMA